MNTQVAQAEYVIWGTSPKNPDHEDVLCTTAKNVDHAKRIMKVLAEEHKCRNMRVQIIDFSEGCEARLADEFKGA